MSKNWFITSNSICGEKMYIATRLKDPAQPMHGGNVEHSGEYDPDRTKVEAYVAELNGEE